MLRIICGVVLVHFALAAPMESVIQRRGIKAKRDVCGPGEGDSFSGCPEWAAEGLCAKSSVYRTYRQFMIDNCGASCGICKAAPTHASTAVAVAVSTSECVGAHNTKRGLHQDTPNLSWDSSLAQGSEDFAIQLANTSPISLYHSSVDYGENLYYYGDTSGTVKACSDAVTSWYSEVQYYDWNNPGSSSTAGKDIVHFAQVVWKDTTAVGCGVAKIVRGDWTHTVVVCHYTPAGNSDGQYGDNVKPRV